MMKEEFCESFAEQSRAESRAKQEGRGAKWGAEDLGSEGESWKWLQPSKTNLRPVCPHSQTKSQKPGNGSQKLLKFHRNIVEADLISEAIVPVSHAGSLVTMLVLHA